MKIWFGYGTEHSANLVMVGHFTSEEDSKAAARIFERIEEQVNADIQADRLVIGEHEERFTDEMLGLLGELDIYSLGPSEVEQFGYEYHIEQSGNTLILRTDELEVSAFLKLMIDRHAKIEVYSAQDFPEAPGQRRRAPV